MERIPVQLVVCDIDDTLIHKDDHLKEETIQMKSGGGLYHYRRTGPGGEGGG